MHKNMKLHTKTSEKTQNNRVIIKQNYKKNYVDNKNRKNLC